LQGSSESAGCDLFETPEDCSTSYSSQVWSGQLYVAMVLAVLELR